VGINQFVGETEGGGLSQHLADPVILNSEQRFTTKNLKILSHDVIALPAARTQ
jgi:hypothetical protein